MPEVAVRESKVSSLGLFTCEPVHAGQVVCEFRLEREITPDSPPMPDLGEHREHCALIDNRFYLIGSPERYANHSCDPNIYLRFRAKRVDIVALREIKAHSELFLDYLINNQGGNSWPCSCGAHRCRGETGRSFLTLPAKFQREYLPLLAPWFVKRYSRELEHLAATPVAQKAVEPDAK